MDTLLNFFFVNLQAPMEESLTSPTEDMEEIEKRKKNSHWRIRQTSMHFIFRMF